MPILLTIAKSPAPAPPYNVDLICQFDPAIVAQLKGVPGLTWDPKRKRWHGPREAAEIAAATLARAHVAKPVWAPDTAISPIGSSLDSFIAAESLRKYQQDGVAWLEVMIRDTGAALLADEMGLGKTPQAIITADVIAPQGNILIVCPAVVRQHWESRITEFSDRFGNDAEMPEQLPTKKADLATLRSSLRRWHVLSYEGFTAAQAKGALPTASLLILDEIHCAANPRSKRSKALKEWRSENPSCPVIGLSGTPMTADPVDLWHPLQLLWPGRFGNEWQFQKRYCDGHYVEIPAIGKSVWEATGKSNTDELASRLAHVMLRRTKADVATEMPSLTRQVIEVEMPRQRQSQQPQVMPSADRNLIGTLLANSETAKLDAAISLAQDVIRGGGKPLLLTLRRETARQLSNALMCPVVTGEDAPEQRQSILEAEGAEAGVATLDSVTTGIDLVSFDTVIMVGLDWLPTKMLQGESRIHRLTQTRPVTAYYLVGLGTIDEAVRERVIDRLDTFACLTGGDSTGGFSQTLKGGTEEEILADLIASVMGQ